MWYRALSINLVLLVAISVAVFGSVVDMLLYLIHCCCRITTVGGLFLFLMDLLEEQANILADLYQRKNNFAVFDIEKKLTV